MSAPASGAPRTAYFDTAYILKCYLPEPDSAGVRACASTAGQLVTSELARAEFAAALHRKVREQWCTAEEAQACADQFAEDARVGVWEFVPCADPVWRRVADVYRALPPTVWLRSADAVHLASAVLAGESLVYSNDRQMAAAADAFGVTVHSLASA